MSSKPVYDRLVFYAGDSIFSEGDEGNWAYLVQSGSVEIYKLAPDGSERILALLGPGRLFGEMALIDDQPRMAGARAKGETTLVLIDRDHLLKTVRNSPPLVRELLQNFSNNLRSITRRHLEQSQADKDAAKDGPCKPEPRPYVGERLS